MFASYVASYYLEELLYKGAFDVMTLDASLAASECLDRSFFLGVIEITDPKIRDTIYHRRFHYKDLEATKKLREANSNATAG